MMHRNKSVNVHDFAMVPRADIPRSSFVMERKYMTAFDSGWLIPVLCEEMLPGDTFNGHMTAFLRLTTPIVPIMDNMYADVFFFFCPNRLVWTNWPKFMGEQAAPGDSISYTVPQVVTPVGGYTIGSLQDYFGLPTVGQVGGAATVSHSTLPLRMYNKIYNDWFRDENLQPSIGVPVDDGPDSSAGFVLRKRGKRKDYFAGALPWVQKGSTSVTLPLGTSAPVNVISSISTGNSVRLNVQGTTTARQVVSAGAGSGTTWGALSAAGQPVEVIADLSLATAATINQLRQAFQIQRLLERDARGGTRYTEIVQAHFGVKSPDARLQRPEYVGGGSYPITVNPIAQTSATGLTGGSTPGGNLNAVGTGLIQTGFTYSAVEHGYVMALVSVRADLTYQQGLRRHWSRSTRYDFYFPVFAMLGEQAILNKEIYCKGDANDALVFGYQERWAELRYLPSEITGKMRSTAAGTLDVWHLAQNFTSLPTLNATFIEESPPIARISAVPSEPQFKYDSFIQIRAARPLPMYSVPGLIDHF